MKRNIFPLGHIKLVWLFSVVLFGGSGCSSLYQLSQGATPVEAATTFKFAARNDQSAVRSLRNADADDIGTVAMAIG